MQLINWLKLIPSDQEIEQAILGFTGIIHLRTLCQALVRSILQSYPWAPRADIVLLFDPSISYIPNEFVAIPLIGPQKLRPDTWRIGLVKSTINVENPSQGSFQVVTVDVAGRRQELAVNLPNASAWSIHFPPEDEDDLNWMVSDFTDAYYDSISSIVVSAIRTGKIKGKLLGDQILMEGSAATICEDERYYLEEIFNELTLQKPWMMTGEILSKLRELGCLDAISDEIAGFVIDQVLSEQNYRSLGEKQWTTQAMFEQLDREIARRMQVPVIRSKLTQELGQDDSEVFESYEQVKLEAEGTATLAELGEDVAAELPASTGWQPPSEPLPMPVLTYIHFLQGFFPLSQQLRRAFDPQEDLLLVQIQVVEDDALPFLVNRSERVIKALDAGRVRTRFLELGIPAGIHLWLEYLGGVLYRITPRPLTTPVTVKCKLARVEEGKLHLEEADIEMRFEGDTRLFKAEMRFEDMEALFREAEQSDLSIFDAMYLAFKELAALHPDGLVHHVDLFNAVFLRYRMCSPRSVVAVLYSRPCFVPVGDGYFRLDLTKRIRLIPDINEAIRRTWIRTPNRAFRIPILQTLSEMGGKAEVSRILKRVEELVKDQLTERDREHRDTSSELQWKNAAEWERNTMKNAGLLKDDSPFGIWEITDSGREYLKNHQAETSDHLPTPEEAVPQAEEEPTPPMEHTRGGQLIVPGLIPPGPLFEQNAEVSEVPAESTPDAKMEEPSVEIPLPTVSTLHPSIFHGVPTHSRSIRPPSQLRGEMQSKTLFSTHYLLNRLPAQPEWSEDVLPTFNALRPFMQKAQQFGTNWNEAQTEDELIKPILSLVGWSYIVQPKARRGGEVRRPDYALFADEAAKTVAQPFQGQDEAFYGRALAIAEAKHWGRPLSQRDKSGRATWKAESNPSYQMVNYLVGTRTPWGILTNGQTWRLYSREVSSTASEFYEIDLGVLFDFLTPENEPSAEQLDLFRRWWLFFRRAAFIPDAQGKSFVERVYEGSTTYAREISETLKDLVFKAVMPEIAGGFVAYRRQELHIQEETPESLNEIYRASLSLLYKLLFLLYAEARSLLPVENADYRTNSLTAIAEWAASQIDQQRNLSDVTFATPRYDALLALFRRVDQGDRSLGIPHYNGGLFNPNTPENLFLGCQKLSDRTVAYAVDLLVRDKGQSVDYAYISVRNLGAIYEGLLENKLKVVDATGKVELVNDKGERKATGSYYTPDYIVEYIVKNTLDPILEARQPAYEDAMGQVTSLRHKLEKTLDAATVRRMRGELDEAEHSAREAFLGIKVLDPAMGSGHFLINAVDHLTDAVIQRMQAYHDAHAEARWEWDPIQQLIERVRSEILAEMAEQDLNVDPRRLDDTALLIRLVMKRCIYGVDLNRMAVELAK
ncbi:MAG: winged helix-turn-helix domain-containing protein, partial [Anaerolineaceae bacterium]